MNFMTFTPYYANSPTYSINIQNTLSAHCVTFNQKTSDEYFHQTKGEVPENALVARTIIQHINNGINYSNWRIEGKGEILDQGIRIIWDGNKTKFAEIPVYLKPDTEYTLVYHVSDSSLSGSIMVSEDQSCAFMGKTLLSSNKGWHKVKLTTKKELILNQRLRLTLDTHNVLGEYITLNQFMLLDGDVTEQDIPYMNYGRHHLKPAPVTLSSPNYTPKNYLENEGTLFDDFQDFSSFQKGMHATLSIDKKNYKIGSQSLKLSASGSIAWADKSIYAQLSDAGIMRIWIYLHTDVSTLDSITIYFSSDEEFAKTFAFYIPSYQFRRGWNLFSIAPSQWINLNGESWNNTMIRMRVKLEAKPGKQPEVSLDSINFGAQGIPQVLFTFDDGWSSQYTRAYSHMAAKKIPGTIYVVPNLVGTPTKVNKAQLDVLYGSGWDIANHSIDHSYMGTFTETQAKEKINEAYSWLMANGYSRAARHIAYPGGQYNSQVLTAMKNLGMLTGRTIIGNYEPLPLDDPYQIKAFHIGDNISLAEVKTFLDKIYEVQGTAILYFHRIVDTPDELGEDGMNWLVSDFKALVDYVKNKGFETPTISKWYEALKGRGIKLSMSSDWPKGMGYSLPSGAADKIHWGGKIERQVGQITLDGTENWSYFSVQNETCRMQINDWRTKIGAKANNGHGLSKDGEFPTLSTLTPYIRSIALPSSSPHLYLTVEKAKISAMPGGMTIQGFKEYLAAHPIDFLFEYEEPKIYHIHDMK